MSQDDADPASSDPASSDPVLDGHDVDLADEDARKGAERTCIVTRTKGSPDAMVRFVIGPDGAVVPDIRRRLPGRGVWVTASQGLVTEAVRKHAFARGFKAKVVVDAALAARVGELLARDALQSLAMANKAGAVTTGFAKVEAAIATGRVLAILHASDAAEDGIRKLDAARKREARHQAGHGGEQAGSFVGASFPPSINFFASEELDLALGRTNVIHAALAVGPAGLAFLARCRRAVDYRAGASLIMKADAKAASA